MSATLGTSTTELAARIAKAARAVDDVVVLDDGQGQVATGAGEARVAGVAIHALLPPKVTVRVAIRLGRPLPHIEREIRDRVHDVLQQTGATQDAPASVAVELGLAGAHAPTGAARAARRPSAGRSPHKTTAHGRLPGRRTLAVFILVAGTAGFAASGVSDPQPQHARGPAAASSDQQRLTEQVPPPAASTLQGVVGDGPAVAAGPGSGVIAALDSAANAGRDDLAEHTDVSTATPYAHTVQPGESLAGIAAAHDLELQKVADANPTLEDATLHPGQTVVLPNPQRAQPVTPEQAVAADLPIEDVLEEVATAYGRDPAMIKAVAWRESRWNQRLVSPAGAIGVMQVRPTTGEMAAARVGRDLDLYDPVDNITAGVAYLDTLVQRHGGNVRAALAAYIQGSSSVRTDGRFPVTEHYVAQVTDLASRFAELSDADGGS